MEFQNTQFKLAECPIARMYTEARVQRIYVGTNEIMKVLIARGL